MKPPSAPKIEERRAPEFAAEMQERARAWLPEWGITDRGKDFGLALLEIAARFNSEVAERLDGAGEKMRRGFLDWLGDRGEAARPSRMPVVFKLADTAVEPVLAEAPVRMQADAGGRPVVFETEKDVRLVPGQLGIVVGVDADNDAFYLPPPGLSSLEPLEPLPTEWRLKSFAAAGAKKMQLDPETGLALEMLIEAGGKQYRIINIENEIVTVEPPLDENLDRGTTVSKVTSFAPFGDAVRNRQEHALYLGHMELLNIESAATIEVVGATALVTGIKWQYWGKTEKSDEPDWQTLTLSDQQKPDAVVLIKLKGAVEPRKINGTNSRWIRAFTKTVEPAATPFTRDELSLRVNATGCPKSDPCSPNDKSVTSSAEAMANTNPLVLDNIFFPLGKEPRQFDAFYLGSEEAFSKKGAMGQLCFEMADRTFSTLAALPLINPIIAGVASDRSLHLLALNSTTRTLSKYRNREPLQPPKPGYLGADAKGNAVALDIRPRWRLPVWLENVFFGGGFAVATSAGDQIWIWRELLIQASSGWIDFGKLDKTGLADDAAVEGLVYLADAFPSLFALFGGKLFRSPWSVISPAAAWSPVPTKHGANPVRLVSIVPVLVQDPSGYLATSSAAGMIGIDDQKRLFHITTNGVCTLKLPGSTLDPTINPVAIEIAGKLNVAGVITTNANPPELIAEDGNGNIVQEPLEAGTKVLGNLEGVLTGGNTFHVMATVEDEFGTRLTTWAPFETPPRDLIFNSRIAQKGSVVDAGAPLAASGNVVIPAGRADILISQFDLANERLVTSDDVEIGVVVPDSVPGLVANDLVVRYNAAGEPRSREIAGNKLTKSGEVFYKIDAPFPAAANTGLDAYDLSETLDDGTFDAVEEELTLDPTDEETVEGEWLWIDDELYKVGPITPDGSDRIAKLIVPNPNGHTPSDGDCDYVRPIRTRGRVAPFMELDTTTAGGSGDWDASLLDRIPLIFPGQTPSEQRAKAFDLTGDNKPKLVVLREEFQSVIVNPPPTQFIVDGVFSEWQRDAGDTSSNPELSWEYSNGKSWSKLNVTLDQTENLKTGGVLQFDVPEDIASSDWAGKTNFWIRARLVGGDYGKETITTTTTGPINNVTKQTIDRSLEGVRPPSVLKLNISYRVCKPVEPEFVLAQDSGTIRDQSDANHTAGAIVEAFVPLALMLGRLSNPAGKPGAPPECPPECSCSNHQTTETATQTVSGQTVSAQTSGKSGNTENIATGRAVFVGLNATPSEAPVNLLFSVERERPHAPFAPMQVEALAVDRLVPIVADDATRALGETGLLSMTFAVPPTRSELFGNENLSWLQLRPRTGSQGSPQDVWAPELRGAYLNAVWASATETLTRELVGSSAGEPNLVLTLARPPVLQGTLELRVKEPLGEEERNALRKNDPNRVLSLVEGLDGDWVLWEQVIDPDDQPADARVYSLDEANGEIRFGDGVHGKIPPIGRDSIVAFAYQRTEPPAPGSDLIPGNTIVPRTVLNMVSPVETVESATAADQAAGGAPSESDERVLRFGFARVRHRERAVTANDIEDLALQSSPDIVQARAFVRRGYIQLVVVMKGKDPVPNAAQVRELRRFLLDAAPATLSPDALRIGGPRIRRLVIELKLRIETLSEAGELGEWVKENLTRFFDTAAGGGDKDGWVLGVNPNEQDIAFSLIDAPHLEGIEKVTLKEIADDRSERSWPESLKANEIVMLADDPFRIEFETAEVTV